MDDKVIDRIDNNKFLYFFARFISYTVSAMIVWILLDLIDKKEFVFSVKEYVIGPIIFGLVLLIASTIWKIIAKKN